MFTKVMVPVDLASAMRLAGASEVARRSAVSVMAVREGASDVF